VDIEVLEKSPMYFKIAVKDQQGPMKFAIVYKTSDFLKGRKPDLVIYFSFTCKEPSQSDHSRASHNVSVISS
jgi:hypothetical protein